jgi:hypothetical protein
MGSQVRPYDGVLARTAAPRVRSFATLGPLGDVGQLFITDVGALQGGRQLLTLSVHGERPHPGIRKATDSILRRISGTAIRRDVPHSRRARSMVWLDHTLRERELKNDFATLDSSGVPEAETDVEQLRGAGARNIRGRKN